MKHWTIPSLIVAMLIAGSIAAGPTTRKSQKPANSSGFGITRVKESLPVVLKTEPPAGSTAVDAAATQEIKVTYSKDMDPGNFSWVRTGEDTFPQTTGKARFLDDKRTCVLPVKLEPGKAYVVWLNKAPYEAFMDADGHRAVPYLLVFETKK
jgi:RNA polymerase sigma-70 factor (ECF subfamily)